jgi:Cof subfamily protein (haloacid dehalogenase superfamily)
LTTRPFATPPPTTPRLIALDVDGTLLNSSHTLHERTVAAIARVRRHGVHVAIATGRPLGAVGEVGVHADYVVAGNGTTVYQMVNQQPGPVLYDRVVTRDRGAPIIAAIRAAVPGVGLALVTSREMVNEAGFEKIVPPNAPIGRRVVDVLEADGDDFRSIVVFHPHHSVDDLIAIVDPMLRPTLALRYAGLDAGEISELDVDKGETLAWLARHLNVDQRDVWAFGDGVNDHEMLLWAGRGHAMGNAGAATKAVADVVVPTNDDHGVAETLDAIEF